MICYSVKKIGAGYIAELANKYDYGLGIIEYITIEKNDVYFWYKDGISSHWDSVRGTFTKPTYEREMPIAEIEEITLPIANLIIYMTFNNTFNNKDVSAFLRQQDCILYNEIGAGKSSINPMMLNCYKRNEDKPNTKLTIEQYIYSITVK